MKASKYSMNACVERFFFLPIAILMLSLTSFNNSSAEKQNGDKFTVVLDAGHGGHDPGNLGNGYFEKNIALSIVLKAGAILEKNPNIKVIYTRKDDTFIDLYFRGEIANRANADLFVSVHCDSHGSNAHGAGTFVLGLHANKQNFEVAKKENSVIYLEDNYQSRYADYDINSPESVIGLTIMQEEFLDNSIALAKAIQDNFSEKLKRNNRKVKQAGFIVLHQTVMPSVLVETGFLTNKEEGAYLNSKKGQVEMGTSIAEAIITYKQNAIANMADFAMNTVPDAPEPKEIPKKKKPKEEVPKKNKKIIPASTEVSQSKDAIDSSAKLEEKTISVSTEKEAAQIIEEAKAKTETGEPSKSEIVKIGPEKSPSLAANKKAVTKSDVVYKVQIMASAKNLPLRPESFNGLNRVAKEPYKNLYRYVYGSTKSLEEAKIMKSNADINGYPTSFIVAYRNGERISFKESLK